MKSITFLLPNGSSKPAGGYKVVYEYANRFVNDGYEVHIMFANSLYFSKLDIPHKIYRLLLFIYHIVTKKYMPYTWFDLDRRILTHYVWSLSERFAPETDVYIATAIKSSEYLNRYKRIPNNRKFYLIQDFENWSVSDERVIKSYNFGLNNITISNWLNRIVVDSGAQSVVIPNGFDFKKFKVATPIENKDKYSISMMYHRSDRKGCVYSYEALNIVKAKYPQLKVRLFGATKPSEQFPDWYEFHHMPSAKLHNEIYNSSAIYIASSLAEGWGLTVGEAMICGAAIVCTDIDGFKEMVVNGESALLSPIKDPEAMAANIIKLIENDELRHRIARNGNDAIQKFSWSSSYAKFKSEIENFK